MLVRLSPLEPIHPEMCDAVLGAASLGTHLARLQDETPLLTKAEGDEWMRMHPLAREVLRERLEALPLSERQATSRLAAQWYAARGLYEQAAEQAFLAGDIEHAIAVVVRNSHQMAASGRGAAVLAWYERLSPAELRQYPALWAPAAWALSMSDRHQEARELVRLILAQPGLTDAARYETALIDATADAFADQLDPMALRLAPWPAPPPGALSGHAAIHYLVDAFVALYRGEPDRARMSLARMGTVPPPHSAHPASPVTVFQAAYCTGLSYLWEGRYALAEQQLRAALAQAEKRLGRNHLVCCNLATALMEAAWNAGSDEDPRPLLAGRLTVLIRFGAPDALMSAYVTSARMADAEGRQDQALTWLESLQVMGQTRHMVRLQVLALHELVMLHARHGRAQTAHSLSETLGQLLAGKPVGQWLEIEPWARLQAHLASALACGALGDAARFAQGLDAATQAEALAVQIKRRGDEVQARILRARLMLHQGAAGAQAARQEALSLAAASGMGRFLQAQGLATGEEPQAGSSAHASALLTVKEREVLRLLCRGLSNKEIARAMDVGEGTVKFHLKNLFGKLDASGRRHAVAKARQLGLVDPSQ
jgi:LuxR family maltose regulon positive regulatory protein